MSNINFKNISINNTWKFFSLLFMMSITSVFASLLMDQKLYKKQKNNNELEILKASFSHNRKELIDVKRSIILNAEKFDLKKHSNIVLVKYE